MASDIEGAKSERPLDQHPGIRQATGPQEVRGVRRTRSPISVPRRWPRPTLDAPVAVLGK